jgi:hypothetical protein
VIQANWSMEPSGHDGGPIITWCSRRTRAGGNSRRGRGHEQTEAATLRHEFRALSASQAASGVRGTELDPFRELSVGANVLLPTTRKASPPNIFCSVNPGSPTVSRRIRSARFRHTPSH